MLLINQFHFFYCFASGGHVSSFRTSTSGSTPKNTPGVLFWDFLARWDSVPYQSSYLSLIFLVFFLIFPCYFLNIFRIFLSSWKKICAKLKNVSRKVQPTRGARAPPCCSVHVWLHFWVSRLFVIIIIVIFIMYDIFEKETQFF